MICGYLRHSPSLGLKPQETCRASGTLADEAVPVARGKAYSKEASSGERYQLGVYVNVPEITKAGNLRDFINHHVQLVREGHAVGSFEAMKILMISSSHFFRGLMASPPDVMEGSAANFEFYWLSLGGFREEQRMQRSFPALQRLLILSRCWLKLASSATANKDAYLIATWIALCLIACVYSYAMGLSGREWLKRKCKIRVRTIKIKLPGRRSMLIALGVINPDREKDKLSWADPFMTLDEDRDAVWGAALDFYNDAEGRE
ncbi:hypothetical protein LY76DRAFT_607668 [Colletotrichum caudatum]|nr:hypothetical protein LY76DRAFT_607668 [Colletotrichum caudatum]